MQVRGPRCTQVDLCCWRRAHLRQQALSEQVWGCTTGNRNFFRSTVSVTAVAPCAHAAVLALLPCAVSPSGVSAAVAATLTPTLPRPQPATATTASHCDSSVPRRRLFRRRHHRRSCPSQASATGGVATACAMLQTWKAASESTPGAMSKARPVWSASVAQATGWPRLAEAWGGLVHGLALKEASGEPAGRSLSHLLLVVYIAPHPLEQRCRLEVGPE